MQDQFQRATPRRFPRLALLALAAAGAATLAGGCARTPAGVSVAGQRELIVTMTVAGEINPSDYYFVVFNNVGSSNPAASPDPVIAAPWLNGFVTGAATSFVEYTGSQPGQGYIIYDFATTNPPLQSYTAVGAPTQAASVTTGSNTLQFRIPLSELATSTVSADATNYIQVNFIATDSLPANSEDPDAEHEFDALGNTAGGVINNAITISTLQDTTYSNQSLNTIEPTGDVGACHDGVVTAATDANAPNLDITSFSVQITTG